MPIKLADIIKQQGRDGSQGLSGSSFYYLVDVADIDFRVDGFVTNTGISGGVSVPAGPSAFGKKYIVLDAGGLGGFSPTQNGIGNNDIIEKRDMEWGIHFDASLSNRGASGGALAYSIPEKAFFYYEGSSWKRLGSGSLEASSLTAGVAIGISAGSNNVLYFNNLGVTGIQVGNTTLTGSVSLTNGTSTTITVAGNEITIGVDTGSLGGNFFVGDGFGNRDQVDLGQSLTFAGSAAISVSGSNNRLTFFNMGVTSFNGQTGAVSYYPPFATASVTGVASFPPTFFSVADGVVSLSGAYASTLTGDTVGATGSLTANTVSGVRVIDARLATASLTGVASFPPTFFSVADGVVSLSGAYASTLTGNTVVSGIAAGVSAVAGNIVAINNLGVTGASTNFGSGISISGITGQIVFVNTGITQANGLTGTIVFREANNTNRFAPETLTVHGASKGDNNRWYDDVYYNTGRVENQFRNSQFNAGAWSAYEEPSNDKQPTIFNLDRADSGTAGWGTFENALGITGGFSLTFGAGGGTAGIYQAFPAGSTGNGFVWTVSAWAVGRVNTASSLIFAYFDGVKSNYSPVFSVPGASSGPQRFSWTFVQQPQNGSFENVAIGTPSANIVGLKLFGLQLERGSVARDYVPTFDAVDAVVGGSVRVSPTGSHFIALTGPTISHNGVDFPNGLSAYGEMGDRLVVATGPTNDPFRTYVRFGNSWIQTGVVGIGQGPVGSTGDPGITGVTGSTGATGAAGITGYNSGAFVPFNTAEQGLSFASGSISFTDTYRSEGLSAVAAIISGLGSNADLTILVRNERDSSKQVIFRSTSTILNQLEDPPFTTTSSLIGSYVVGNASTFPYTGATGGLLVTIIPDGVAGQTGSTGSTGPMGHHISVFNSNGTKDQIQFIDANKLGFSGNNLDANTTSVLNFMMSQLVTGQSPLTISMMSRSNPLNFAVFHTPDSAKNPTYTWEFDGNYIYGNKDTIGKSSTVPIDIHFTINGRDGATGAGGFATTWGITAGAGGPAGTTAGQIWVYRTAVAQTPTTIFMPPYDRFGNSLTGIYQNAWAFGGTNGNPIKGFLYVTLEGQGAQGVTSDTFVFNVTSIGSITPARHTPFVGTIMSGSTGMFGPNPGLQNAKTRVHFIPAGAAGQTGQVSLSGYGTYSGLTHSSSTLDTFTNVRGRKYLYMKEDGGITWDYIRPVDIYNSADFYFGIQSFSFNPGGVSLINRLSATNYNLLDGGAAFDASYKLGPPVTANINANTPSFAVSGFPIKANNDGSTEFGAGSPTITGGTTTDIVITLQATGTNDISVGGFQYVTSSITFKNRNDFVYGVTFAPYLTGSAQTPNLLVGGKLETDFSSTYPAAQQPNGFTKTFAMSSFGAQAGVDQYIYVAYPARLHSASFTFQLVNAQTAYGGMQLQSAGFNGGLETVDYTNSANYTEPYKIWRSNQAFSPSTVPNVYFKIVT